MEWKTAITEIKHNDVRIRGYRLHELLGKLSFAQMLALLLKGELPTAEAHIVIDAMLLAAADRGVRSPAVAVTRQAAASGSSIRGAIAAGLLSLSENGGPAVGACMELLLKTMDRVAEEEMPLEEAVMQIVEETLQNGQQLPGFGTSNDEPDPVANNLIDLVQGLELPMAGACNVLRALEVALTAHLDRYAPLNLNGALAAALCELDYSPQCGDAFLLIGRLPGLVSHFMEEKTRQEPGRLVEPGQAIYDGAEPRDLI